MHLTSGIMPNIILMLYGVMALAGIVLALWRVDRRVFFDREQGLYIGLAYAFLCALYMVQAGVRPGMTLHFLGVMLTVMMFGPWTAILLLTVVHVTLATAFQIGAVETLGYNISLCVLLPVAVAAAIHTFSYYRLPRTFPVYIIQVGIGDLLCMWSVALVLSLHLTAFVAHYSFDLVFREFGLILVMMGGMEAMISTMIASLLVCFLPRALITFSDEEYLHGK